MLNNLYQTLIKEISQNKKEIKEIINPYVVDVKNEIVFSIIPWIILVVCILILVIITNMYFCYLNYKLLNNNFF